MDPAGRTRSTIASPTTTPAAGMCGFCRTAPSPTNCDAPMRNIAPRCWIRRSSSITSTASVVACRTRRPGISRSGRILGVSGPAPDVGPVATTYAAELDSLKAWIALRLSWLDANMPGLCAGGIGVEEASMPGSLACYPNPGNGRFHFEGTVNGPGPHMLAIHDVAWRLLDQVPVPQGAVSLDHEIRGSGTYFFTLQSGGRIVQQGRLVVYSSPARSAAAPRLCPE